MARSLNMTFGVWKPWFLYRLRQIVRRLLSAVRPPSSTSGTVDTSWGGRVIVDRTRAIRRDNDGMAMLADGGPASVQAVQVVVERLDDLIDTGASMLKLDVEGFEASVLRGAQRLLSERRLRHIVFEDHDVERSAVVRLLKASGYRLFAIGWSMRGLVLGPIERGPLAAPFEAPSFVATTEPAAVIARTAPRGWHVLSARFSRRRR